MKDQLSSLRKPWKRRFGRSQRGERIPRKGAKVIRIRPRTSPGPVKPRDPNPPAALAVAVTVMEAA